MSKFKFYISIFSLLACLSFFAGCEQVNKQQTPAEKLAEQPTIMAKEVVSDYIAGALSATGGRELWLQTKEIEYDCVVTFHKPDGSFYLTRQNHYIKPWSHVIRMSANEPRGNIVCQLSQGDFKVVEGSVSKKGLPQGLCERDLAEALREALTSAVSFLNKNKMFTRIDRPLRKEGMWYNIIERLEPNPNKVDQMNTKDQAVRAPGYWSKVFYYQRKDSLLVDMFSFASYERQEFIGVRCYDYNPVVEKGSGLFERSGVFIPRKVELFRTDSKGIFQNKIAEIDIKSCTYAPY
ncbi:MAG: hypothetical protein ACYTE8_08920 [Planctomycetota bacterium]|jgi:hypothetical protein